MRETDVIFNILVEDNEVILYRKSLRGITDSVTAAILLHQIMFRSKNRDKFYKFKTPCSHKLYKDGDSWTEELGFSIKEFDNALKKIGTKITQKVKKSDVFGKTDATGIVLYWIDRDRVTWYQLNREFLAKHLKRIYLNDQWAFSKNTNGHLPLVTETTTENTTDINKNSQSSSFVNQLEEANEKLNDYSPEKKADLNILVPYLASLSNLQVKDELRAVALLGFELARVCKLEISLTSITNLKTIARVTLGLNTKNVVQSDLNDYETWWYTHNWKGKREQAPTPGDLGDTWGQFEAQKVARPSIDISKDGFYV